MRKSLIHLSLLLWGKTDFLLFFSCIQKNAEEASYCFPRFLAKYGPLSHTNYNSIGFGAR
jgi:hypothetical protein